MSLLVLACGGRSDSDTSEGVPVAPPTCENVAFSDPAVERSVRAALEVPAGPLPQQLLVELSSLTLSSAGSFDGIQCASGLRTLHANLGGAFDAAPLGALVHLETLSLENHNFRTLMPLANLRALRTLDLGASLERCSLRPIGQLTELKQLDISHNLATDLHLLASLTELESLAMIGTWAGDYGQPSNLRGLGALAGMTRLKLLRADSATIVDLAPLVGLTALEHLELVGNSIADLAPIAGASRLTFLHAGTNRITTTAALKRLTALTSLNLSENPLSDLSGLVDLTALKHLSIFDTEVSDLTPLAALDLTYLSLERSRVSDLSPLVARGQQRKDCPRLYARSVPLSVDTLEYTIPKLCELGWIVEWHDADGVARACRSDACRP